MQSLVNKTGKKAPETRKEALCCAKVSNHAVGCHD